MIIDDRMFRVRNLSPAVLRDARFRRGRLRDPGYLHPPKRTTSIGTVGARGRDDRRRRSPRHFLLRRILLQRLAPARRARVTHVELRRRRRRERDGCFLHRGPCRLDLKRGTSAVLRSMLSAMRGGSIVNSNLYPSRYVNLLTTTGYRADTLFVLIPLTQNSG